MEWFFDGLGSELVSIIIGFVFGGVSGYKVGISKSSIKQSQKAGRNSKQMQTGVVVTTNKTDDEKSSYNSLKIRQKQKAGKDSDQQQEGEKHV